MPDVVEFAVARLDLRPGDRLVVRVKGHVSEQAEANIKAEIERFAPGVPVLVVDDGVDLLALGAPLTEPEQS